MAKKNKAPKITPVSAEGLLGKDKKGWVRMDTGFVLRQYVASADPQWDGDEFVEDMNCLEIITPKGAYFRAFRCHRINPSFGDGGAYYRVRDKRGWTIGEANTLGGLLFLLTGAEERMSALWEIENDMLGKGEKL